MGWWAVGPWTLTDRCRAVLAPLDNTFCSPWPARGFGQGLTQCWAGPVTGGHERPGQSRTFIFCHWGFWSTWGYTSPSDTKQ